MEGHPKRAHNNNAVAPLRMERFIPIRDVRKLVWRYLTPIDREVARCAMNIARQPHLPSNADMVLASGNRFALLKWGHEHGMPLTERACAMAASRGDMSMLQWLRAKGCPWDESACAWAAMRDKLRTLQWLRANLCPWDPDDVAMQAAWRGYTRILEWLRDKADTDWWHGILGEHAANGGQVETLQWLDGNGFATDSDAYQNAIDGRGNDVVAIFEWLFAHNVPWPDDDSDEIFESAAYSGHVAVLQLLLAKGIRWRGNGAVMCEYAARNGQLEMLQFLRANGCEWHPETCARAASGGHLKTLQWARAQGCPWDKDAVFTEARNYQQEAVIRWLQE
jgi:hypothetical protein